MYAPKFKVNERVQINFGSLSGQNKVTILHVMDDNFNNEMSAGHPCYFVKFDNLVECRIDGNIMRINSLVFTEGYLQNLEKPLKIGEHEVRFAPDHINVGCQRIEKETILKIAEKFK